MNRGRIQFLSTAKIVLTWFIIFILVVCIITVPIAVEKGSNSSDTETLILVNVLFRHGERTPDAWSTYPKDPYKNQTYKPGYGQLNKKGKETIYQLGQTIRQRYSGFLGSIFNPSTLYAESTNFKRTKNSLQILLASLFPPDSDAMFEEGLLWSPISFEYGIGQTDISDPFYFCPGFLESYYSYVLTDKALTKFEPLKAIYKLLEVDTGLNIKIPRHACKLFDTLKTQEENGLKLPEWTKQYYPDVLKKSCYLHNEFTIATRSLIKLSGGFLLKKILEEAKAIESGKSSMGERKINLYSAHDINIVLLLGALKVYYPNTPSYGAAIFIEVHQKYGDYYLKIIYREAVNAPERILRIPECAENCPLDQAEAILRENVPGSGDSCASLGEI